jgi:MFS family permease
MGKNENLIKLAILAVFFVPFSTQIVTPGIQTIANVFPDVPFTTIALIITLPSLMTIFFSLLAGKIAGTVMSTKSVTVIGLVLLVLGGTAPYFLNSLPAILVCRGIFGIGVGLLVPLGATLVFSFFDGEARESLMGLGTVSMNTGGIVFAMLGGWVATFGWQNIFLIHLIGIILLILVVLFLPKQEIQTQAKPDTNNVAVEKDKLPLAAYGIMFLVFLLMLLVYPVLTNMSTVIINENIGTAAAAGIVITMYTVGGIIGGAVFAKLSRLAKGLTATTAIIIVAVGLAFITYGNSLLLLIIGSTLAGIGFGVYLPHFYMLMGKACKPSVTAFGMSLIMVGANIGLFLSPYFYAIIAQVTGQTGLRFPFLFAMVCYIIIALIIAFILKEKPSEEAATA